MENNKVRAFIAENPVLVLFLGACPAMGASAAVIPALGMALAVLATMLVSTLLIGALRKLIPAQVKLPACILITAGVVSLVQLLMNALLPGVFLMLGVYLAVVAVDLLIFSGAESALERPFGAALGESLLAALGFAAAILVMAAVREVLGAGSFAGIDLPFFSTYNIPVLTQTSGGFMVFAFLLAAVAALRRTPAKAGEGVACAAAGLCVLENTAKEGTEA